MPSIPPRFQLLPLASPRAKRGADVRKPPSASIQHLLHQDSNGTSTRWLIETGLTLRLQAESVWDLGAGWSPRGAVVTAHRRVDTPWHSPIQPPAMGQIV
jgi:hypothetical protein